MVNGVNIVSCSENFLILLIW